MQSCRLDDVELKGITWTHGVLLRGAHQRHRVFKGYLTKLFKRWGYEGRAPHSFAGAVA